MGDWQDDEICMHGFAASRRSLFKAGAALGLSSLTLSVPELSEANSPVGTLLVHASAWDGVGVYSNGNSYLSDYYGTYGWEYQCVELVQRFYANRGYPDIWYADAADMYNKPGSSSSFTDFIRTPNPGSRKPAWGDVLVFNRSGASWSAGHVAVVTGVTSNRVYFVEQNIGSQTGLTATGKGSLPMSYNKKKRKYTITVPRTAPVKYPSVRGWLHTTRPAVAWETPVRNEIDYTPPDPWATITLRIRPRGDKTIDSVGYWRWDANDPDWVFIAEATRSPWSVSLDLGPVAWGWCLVAADVVDVYGKWATNHIWLYLDQDLGRSRSESDRLPAPPPLPPSLADVARREVPRNPEPPESHKDPAARAHPSEAEGTRARPRGGNRRNTRRNRSRSKD